LNQQLYQQAVNFDGHRLALVDHPAQGDQEIVAWLTFADPFQVQACKVTGSFGSAMLVSDDGTFTSMAICADPKIGRSTRDSPQKRRGLGSGQKSIAGS